MYVYQIAANQNGHASTGALMSAVRKPERSAEGRGASPRAPMALKHNMLDLCAIVWRERKLAFIVAACILLAGAVTALLQPRGYGAEAQLLVRLGQEYVFEPRVGDRATAGEAPELSAITNAEMRLVTSPELVRRVIRTMRPETLYPDVARLPEARRLPAAERAFMRHFSARTAPDTPIIALRYEHKDARVAAATLNTLIDQYLAYRREMLIGSGADALSGQASGAQARYAAASTTLSAFLVENGVTDFDTELRALADLASVLEAQIFDARARQLEASARASSLRAQMNSTPSEIELYSESDARRALVALQLEREQALAQYQDDAPQIRAIDRRIQQLQAFLAEGDPVAASRRGPNPVHQQIAGDLATAQAEARAQGDRVAALSVQRDETRERLRRLQEIEPRYRELLRQRSVLEASAQGFAARAEETRSFRDLAGQSTDNISVMERATPPDRGRSLRWPIAIVTVLLAGAAALTAALVRGLLRRRFPTASSVARTLETPLLGVTIAHRRAPAPQKRLKRIRAT